MGPQGLERGLPTELIIGGSCAGKGSRGFVTGTGVAGAGREKSKMVREQCQPLCVVQCLSLPLSHHCSLETIPHPCLHFPQSTWQMAGATGVNRRVPLPQLCLSLSWEFKRWPPHCYSCLCVSINWSLLSHPEPSSSPVPFCVPQPSMTQGAHPEHGEGSHNSSFCQGLGNMTQSISP